MENCRYLLLILSQFFSLLAFTQIHQLDFERFGVKEGLSDIDVSCLVQDSRGFVWIGTANGLNRYDGHQFKTFFNDPSDTGSISSNYVKHIIEDSKGNIWVATWGGGLNLFDRKLNRFKRYLHRPGNKISVSSNCIYKVAEDRSGKIWLATNKGVTIFYPEKEKFVRLAHDQKDPTSISDNNVTALYCDSHGTIWLGTQNGGLYRFKSTDGTFIRYLVKNEKNGSNFGNTILSVFEDTGHRLWIGTALGGLNKLDQKTGAIQSIGSLTNSNSLSNSNIQCINEDGDGNLWIGTENKGLFLYSSDAQKLVQYINDDLDERSLSSASIASLLKDSSGNMWVGLLSGGINLHKKSTDSFSLYRHTSSPQSLSNNFVLSIYEDKNENLWIGTDGGGLNQINNKTGESHVYKHGPSKNCISGNHITAITGDDNNNLWIGTWGGGLSKFNPQTKLFTNIDLGKHLAPVANIDNIYAVTAANDGKIWAGTFGEGIFSYDEPANRVVQYKNISEDEKSLSNDNISSILEDGKGRLWVGTIEGGINLFEPKTNNFIRFTEGNKKLLNNSISQVFESRSGVVYACTLGSGLHYFDRQEHRFVHTESKNSFASQYIKAILEDQSGNIWVSTNKGISKYDPSVKSITNYSAEDGLQGGSFKNHAAFKGKSGKLYFGGVNGYISFVPEKILGEDYVPPIVLTDFLLFNKSVPVAKDEKDPSPLKQDISETKSLLLSYNESFITFQFASLDFSPPDKKVYAYQLYGFDNDWNIVGNQNTATYTGLNPGKYIFKVKAQNSFGQWSAETLTLYLFISPPIWLTWWFKILATIVLIGSLTWFYKYWLNSVERKQIKLKNLVNERTSEIEEQSKKLIELNTELQSQSLELKNQKILEQKARQEAEHENQAKSTFLATMSHEIRTPLNGIIGMAALLSETVLAPEQREYIETIMTSGDNLIAVINDILDFSKIESGNMEIEQEDFDLRSCVEEVMDIFSHRVAVKDLDLIYEIDLNVPPQIIGDSLRLKQILINLISNAIKFTHNGEVYLKIYLISEIQDNSKVVLGFQVKDTGIGIPENKINYLFDSFTQVDASTTRRYGGTGLGLAIAERLVKLMGGEIGVKSKLEIGSTFVFTIQCSISKKEPIRPPSDNMAELYGKKVLIIDDNPTNLKILQLQLEQWKLVPQTALSVPEALEIVDSSDIGAFDLIITDMQMPDMDGVDLATAIRKRSIHTPMIMLSSIGVESKKIYPGLFSFILTKPVKQQRLIKSLQSVLSPSKGTIIEDPQTGLLDSTFSYSFPLNILIAEDNIINQKLIQKILHKLGYETDIASDGLEVLNFVVKKEYNVILMDVQMPGMDGAEATQAIRGMSIDQPYIIAMTANAMSKDREECLNVGMDDYIAKPLRLNEIIKILKNAYESLRKRLVG